jgi:hypothetical protein
VLWFPGLNPDSQDYREDSETNFSALIDPARPFGAAEQLKKEQKEQEQEEQTEEPAVISSSSKFQSAIENKTEDIRLGRQEVSHLCCHFL